MAGEGPLFQSEWLRKKGRRSGAQLLYTTPSFSDNDDAEATLFNAWFFPASEVSGSLAATEAGDTASVSGDVAGTSVSGALAATETSDSASVSGSVISSGALAATEATDTASISGAIVSSGALSANETADSASISGAIVVSGSLAATEASDAASVSGNIAGAAAEGTLAASESADTAAFDGSVTGGLRVVLGDDAFPDWKQNTRAKLIKESEEQLQALETALRASRKANRRKAAAEAAERNIEALQASPVDYGPYLERIDRALEQIETSKGNIDALVSAAIAHVRMAQDHAVKVALRKKREEEALIALLMAA